MDPSKPPDPKNPPPLRVGYRFSPGGKPEPSRGNRLSPTPPPGDEQPAAGKEETPADKAPEPGSFPRPDIDSISRAVKLPPSIRAKDKRRLQSPAIKVMQEPVQLGEPKQVEEVPQTHDRRADDDKTDRDPRLNCNFPGLLKILIPEKSFLPITLPVRVANISASGAMVEIHDRTKLESDIALANRFFELKVAHPEVPLLRGTIAWWDTRRPSPVLGLSCFDRLHELSQVLGPSNPDADQVLGPPPLPAPKLDAYPNTTAAATLTLQGTASADSEEITVRGDDGKYTTPLQKGRFTIVVPLKPDQENHFSLRAFAGTRKSRAIPIRITREGGQRGFQCDVDLTTSQGASHIKVDFLGNVRQAERIIFRLSQLMATAERVSLQTRLESSAVFDKRLYEALRSEAKMLSADTEQQRLARMLDDMM